MGLKSVKASATVRRSADSGKVLPAGSAALMKKIAGDKKSASAFLKRAGIITKSGALTAKYK